LLPGSVNLDMCDGRHVCEGGVRRRERRAGDLAAQQSISPGCVPAVRCKIVPWQKFLRESVYSQARATGLTYRPLHSVRPWWATGQEDSAGE
jgi:hypothetical protein